MKNVWLNLPVKDVVRSKKFYKSIGFRPNPMHENAKHLGSFLIGEKDIVLMLFQEAEFEKFAKNKIADTLKGSEILINIDAESRGEVDLFATKVVSAGGKVFAPPGESEGWMYAFGFSDPDGHRWCMLHMDFSKMPTGE